MYIYFARAKANRATTRKKNNRIIGIAAKAQNSTYALASTTIGKNNNRQMVMKPETI